MTRDGYELENRAETILEGLGIGKARWQEPVENFSGGWTMRIALAQILLLNPDCLLIDEPIARHKRDRLRMVVAAGGRSAQTRIRVLARTTSVALVECELLTGRTHQIRVHLAHLRAPLMGDPLYGGPGRWKDVDDQPLLLPHPALHAWKLSVDHPETGVRIDAEAPIPDAFRTLAAALGLPGF